MKVKLIFNTDPNAPTDEEIEERVIEKLKNMYINSINKK
jgi:hypothetical protein